MKRILDRWVILLSHSFEENSMIASFAMLIGLVGINADPPADTSQVVREFDLSDAAGKKRSIKEWEGSKAVVFFFIWSECPASNGYAPELTRLFKAFTDKGVKF